MLPPIELFSTYPFAHNIGNPIFHCFKKVRFKKTADIHSVAQIVLVYFKNPSTVSDQNFQVIPYAVEKTESIASETKTSLISSFESAHEIYKNPES